jgi:hypothetical protein
MKRHREDELTEEVEGIKSEIRDLKISLAEWKAKAEKAENDGQKEKADEHWKDYRLINTQLADNTKRLRMKEEEFLESQQKREKIVGLGKLEFLFNPLVYFLILMIFQIGRVISLGLYVNHPKRQQVQYTES